MHEVGRFDISHIFKVKGKRKTSVDVVNRIKTANCCLQVCPRFGNPV